MKWKIPEDLSDTIEENILIISLSLGVLLVLAVALFIPVPVTTEPKCIAYEEVP